MPSSLARACARFEVALRYPQIHSLGLVERMTSRLAGRLDLAFGAGSGAELAPLKPIENVALFRTQLVVHVDRLLR